MIAPTQATFGGVTITSGIDPTAGLVFDSRSGTRGDVHTKARFRAQAAHALRQKNLLVEDSSGRFVEDAAGTALFARQAEYIYQKLYEAEFALYKATQLFPTDFEVSPGALSFTWRMLTRRGSAQVIDANVNATDLGYVDVDGAEQNMPVLTLAAVYGFTVVDQLVGSFAGIPIEMEKAKATREAIAELEDLIAAKGYSNTGTFGVTNGPATAYVAQVSTGGTWAAQIAAATSDDLLAAAAEAIQKDLAAIKQQVANATLRRHQVTNFALPTNLYTLLESTTMPAKYRSDSLLVYLEKVLAVEIDDWVALNNAGSVAGSGGLKTLVVGYEKNPDVVSLVYAQPFVQLAPVAVRMGWEVPCYSRIGGAKTTRPLGLAVMQGL